ncbi:hypothetical protein NC653_018068 [Populus alba x Populus x berolinensis]|uniref:Uncharacterized protein n=1 Tax=Populus alba x Populus x berolinensis TaxID=444605 RepID=A0AAD6QRS2_9ROSI|nr:hypothetical protein NC653_018061 [Populus alba x Populus x berolinensis]KAJ6995483.1 hypothetical protein NC653_018068 [Populus alba x Populus x berolinensis]
MLFLLLFTFPLVLSFLLLSLGATFAYVCFPLFFLVSPYMLCSSMRILCFLLSFPLLCSTVFFLCPPSVSTSVSFSSSFGFP